MTNIKTIKECYSLELLSLAIQTWIMQREHNLLGESNIDIISISHAYNQDELEYSAIIAYKLIK